ncbi:MAG: hypothetical protein ACYC0U_07860, partial [Ilumatobacteraceae bacterium]
MKLVGIISSWLFFAIGIPTALILGGFTFRASLVEVSSDLSGGNREIFLLHLASVSLWLIWIYGLCTFVHDLWQLKFDNKGRKTSFGFRRWTTMCAAAVWSLLLASHASVTTNKSKSIDVARNDVKQVTSKVEANPIELPSPTPLALSASTVLVTGILQFVRQRRERVLRNSVPHSQTQSLSRRSQSTLTELQLAEVTTRCDGLRMAMNTLMESESSPILASWQPNSTPCSVLQRTEQNMGVLPLCCVPLGLTQGEIMLLTLSRGEALTVNLDEGNRARSVLAHLTHSIVLETLGSNTSVIVCGFTDAELINAHHLSKVNSMERLFECVLSVESSQPVIVCSVDPLSTDIVDHLRAIGCGVVTASTNTMADVTLLHTQHGWRVAPTQQLISLYGISFEESTAVARLIDEVARPTIVPTVGENFSTPLD